METYSITEYQDFNWETYKNLNPYLYIIGLRTKEEYEKDYLQEGRYLGRHYKNEQKISPHTFHILIATIGKLSIFNMLNSLKKELLEQDYLTIVFESPEYTTHLIKSEYFIKLTSIKLLFTSTTTFTILAFCQFGFLYSGRDLKLPNTFDSTFILDDG